MTELLPCPFCGASDLVQDENGCKCKWIVCNGCGVTLDDSPHGDCADLWNARVPAQGTWQPIEAALRDVRVTGEQQTLFVARFGRKEFPSYNTVYYDFMHPGASESHPWIFADGGGAYHKDWPTHWMLADEAAPTPAFPSTEGGGK